MARDVYSGDDALVATVGARIVRADGIWIVTMDDDPGALVQLASALRVLDHLPVGVVVTRMASMQTIATVEVRRVPLDVVESVTRKMERLTATHTVTWRRVSHDEESAD